jgi:RimJ/RimL family protein N-acetyltransferase
MKLETKRLYLRNLENEDKDNFLALLTQANILACPVIEKEINKFRTPEKFFSHLSNIDADNERYNIFTMIQKNTKEFVGIIGVILQYSEFEGFYFLSPPSQHQGYAIESLKKLMEYSFLSLNLPDITCTIQSQNSQAWKAAERAGFVYLGMYNNYMSYKIEKKDFLNRINL